MKLALLDATRCVCREALTQAVAAGYVARPWCRPPSKLSADVHVVRHDLPTPDIEVISAALRDHPRHHGCCRPPTAGDQCRAGRRRTLNPPDTAASRDLLMRYLFSLLLSPLSRRIFGRAYIDSNGGLVERRKPDWTVIRPPRLTNGPLTGTYRTARDGNLRHGLTISQPDVADLMLTVLEQPETVRHFVGVGYQSGARESRQRRFR